ncbi:hypothetical protein G6F63_015751 [Rhizopus arrhizus]|nr:hypothetical protein G6F63_015751 [Rhizopus arrhizus]
MNYYGRNVNRAYVFNNLADFAAGRVNQYVVRAPRAGGSYDDIPANYTLKNTGRRPRRHAGLQQPAPVQPAHHGAVRLRQHQAARQEAGAAALRL